MKNILFLLAAIVLLSAQLTAQLVQQWSSIVYDIDNVKSIITDNDGNSFICGDLDNTPFGWDIVAIKYNTEGDTIWKKRFDGDMHGNDNATKILADEDGNAYVYGTTYEGFDFYPILIKYSPAGAELFKKIFYEIPGSAADMEINDAVYVLMNYGNCTTAKINFSGDTVWTNSYGLTGVETVYCNEMDIDGAGNIVAAGEYLGDFSGSYYEVLGLKYTAEGAGPEVLFYNGLLDDEDRGVDVGTDGENNIYITGFTLDTPSTSPSYNVIVLKYVAGDLVWEVHYDKTIAFNYHDYPLEIAVNTMGQSFTLIRSEYAGYAYELIGVNEDGFIDWEYDFEGTAWDIELMNDESIVVSAVENDTSKIINFNAGGALNYEVAIDGASGIGNITTDDDENILVIYGVISPLPNTYLAKYTDTTDVSIEGYTNETFHIFPNPATDILYLSNVSVEAAVTIFAITGEEIKKILSPLSAPINISDIPPGIYLITVANKFGEIVQAEKFVIE